MHIDPWDELRLHELSDLNAALLPEARAILRSPDDTNEEE